MLRFLVSLALLLGPASAAGAAAAPCQPEPGHQTAIVAADASGAWCVAGKAAPGEDDSLRFMVPAGAPGWTMLSLEALPGQGGGLRLARYSADGYHQTLWQGALPPDAGGIAVGPLLLAEGEYVAIASALDGALVYRLRVEPAALPAPLPEGAALDGTADTLLQGTGAEIAIPWHLESATPGVLWSFAAQTPLGTHATLLLTDAAGTAILSTTDKDAANVFRLPDLELAAGDYRLRLIGLEAGSPALLSVRQDARPPAFAAEPDGAPGEAHPLTLGVPAIGGMSTAGIYEDHDHFTFELPPGGARRIDAGVSGPRDSVFTLALVDAAGIVLMQRRATGEVRLRDLVLSAGRHWLRVSGTLDPTATYRLLVEDAGSPPAGSESEPNDVASVATPLRASQPLTGTFVGDDSDYIDLGVSGELQLWTVEAIGEGLGRLALYDNLGAMIAVANAGADDANLRLSRIVLPPGRNLLRLDGTDGRWLLRSQALGPPLAGEEIEPNDDEPRALALFLDQVQTGWLDRSGDRDLYAFHLTAERHVVIEFDAPPDFPVEVSLAWGALASRILASTTTGAAGETQRLRWDALLPPGDYLIDLEPYDGHSLEPYRLVVRSAPYFLRPIDLEPNEAAWQARALPVPAQIEGEVFPDSADWYRLPDGLAPATVTVAALAVAERGVDLRLARAGERWPETLATLSFYGSGETKELTLPGGDGLLLQVEGGPGPYAFALGTPPADAPPALLLTAALAFDASAVAAFETVGQALGGRLRVQNDGAAPLRVAPLVWTSEERWTLQGLPDTIDLAPGEAREIPIRLLVAPDTRDDAPVAIEVALRAESGGTAIAQATVAVAPGIAPVAPYLFPLLPREILGGLNVAAAVFGATTDSAAAGLIDGVVDGAGVVLNGAYPPVIDLAGDAPQALAGVILQPAPGAPTVERLADFAVEVSADGTSFVRVLQARLSPLAREQGFVFDAPVKARLVRLVPLTRQGAPDAERALLTEFKAVALPAVLTETAHDIAAIALGGHVVRSLGFDRLSLNGEDAQWPGDRQVTLPADGDQTWMLAFRNNRAARIAAIVWHERADTQTEAHMQAVEVAASLAGPLGPWQPLGRWQLGGELPALQLEQPVWARALAFRLIEPASGMVALPERIAVYEAADGLSILGEWGDASRAGPYEASLPALPAPPALPPVGHAAEKPTPLALGSEALGRVRRGVREDWYALDLPADTLWIRADFAGGLAPEVLLTLVDGAGEETTLVPVPDHPGRIMAPAGPGPWKLRVTQPPQSVAVAWDTSGSIGALVAAVARAVKQFSWELQPGREEINLFPFRGDGSAPLLAAWSGDPAVVYAALHAYPWADNSSDAESALLAAAEALEARIGTRAVALITDAAYTGVFEDEALWQALERGRVRVFAIHLPVDPDPKRALAQINLMQDWASAGGGTFMRFATQDDGEVAFRRITAWLARPADYAFKVTAEATPPPPGTLSVVFDPEADAGPGGTGEPLAVEIVLDASGSMLADLGGRARIVVAKQGLSDLGAGVLPEGVTVGLRVFGHRGGTSCQSELVLPLAPLDRAAFAAAVEKIRVKEKAKTALAESIRLAGADLAQLSGRRILVLVTDGLETCGGDPQAEIARLRDQGLDVRLNVVGFALDDPSVRDTFAQWASAGGGSYFDAADPAALAAAIGEAASGVPFLVLDRAGKELAKGAVGGPPLELPPGRYRLLVGERAYAIEIRSGEPLTLVVEQP